MLPRVLGLNINFVFLFQQLAPPHHGFWSCFHAHGRVLLQQRRPPPTVASTTYLLLLLLLLLILLKLPLLSAFAAAARLLAMGTRKMTAAHKLAAQLHGSHKEWKSEGRLYYNDALSKIKSSRKTESLVEDGYAAR